MTLQCTQCKYEISEYSFQIEYNAEYFQEHVRALNAGDRQTFLNNPFVTLFCPACGSRKDIFLSELGVTLRGNRQNNGEYVQIIQWNLGRDPNEPIRLGKITFKFTDATVIQSIQDLCYRNIPVFISSATNALQVPHFPLKPEFFSLLDISRVNDPQCRKGEVDPRNNKYTARIPLKGLKEFQSVSLELFLQNNNPQLPLASRAFSGFNCCIWPDVTDERWKLFFMDLVITKEELVRNWPDIQIEYTTGDGVFVAFSQKTTKGSVRFHVVENRPKYLHFAFGPNAGGLFDIWHLSQVPNVSREREGYIGIDFGTSNTCVAFTGTDNQPGTVPLKHLRKVIFGDAPSQNSLNQIPEHYPFPPIAAFGKNGDVLPSELLAYPGKGSLGDLHENAVPFRDYTISSALIDPSYPEDDFIISEIKFQEMFSKNNIRANVWEIQQFYLQSVLLVQLANIFNGHANFPVCESYKVAYSYPSAFNEQDKEYVRDAYHNALNKIMQWVNIQIEIDEHRVINEAIAAGANAGAQLTDYHYVLYADLGGGTLDVLLQARGQRQPRIATSIRYAGSIVLNSYLPTTNDWIPFEDATKPTSVLANNITLPLLKRKIRECTNLTDVLQDPRLFSATRRMDRQERCNYFFLFLTEYLARLLAATILNEQKTEDCVVAFVPLGNSWGFLSDIPPGQNTRKFAMDLKERVNEILRECNWEKGIATLKAVEVGNFNIPHAKAAVAYGLLRNVQNAQGITETGSLISILGVDTQVTNPDGANFMLPWNTPVSQDSTLNVLPEIKRVTRDSSLLWKVDGACPVFPAQHIRIDTLQQALTLKMISIQDKSRWAVAGLRGLARSPYDVMMEEVFSRLIFNNY